MDAAKERPHMTPHGLCLALEDFVRDNENSRDVSLRWLAAYLNETLMLCRRVRADTLDDAERRLVASHRLGEIEKAKAERQREIDSLDSEARKLSAA